MSDYKLLTDDCPPGKHCPKVVRSGADRVAIVGAQITDPETLAALGVGPGEAAIEITEVLYRAGYDVLDRRESEAA